RLVSSTNPDGQTISYTYDPAGNETSLTTPAGTTKSAYEALNRLQSVTDSTGKTTRYIYDADGNLIKTERPYGSVETRGYDALNRLITLSDQGPAGLIASYSDVLGPTGSPVQVTEGSGRKVTYTYDALDRVTREAISDPTLGNRTID